MAKQPSSAFIHCSLPMLPTSRLVLQQATKLIMAHMAKEPFEATVWPLAGIALQVSLCVCVGGGGVPAY